MTAWAATVAHACGLPIRRLGPCGGRLVVATILGLPPAALADSGGPDAFGYTFLDSDSGGPQGDYEVGQFAERLSISDDGSVAVNFEPGFHFPFYGADFSSITVHNNGGLTFSGSGDLSYEHSCPVSGLGRPTILAWWGDLAASVDGIPGVYVSTAGPVGGRYVLIEWYQMVPYDHIDAVTFEVKLFSADGRVELHYDDVDTSPDGSDNGAQAAVGIGSSTATLAYSCDLPSLRPDFAITFYPPTCDDWDGDGSCPPDDCDDQNADIGPGEDEVCDGVDTDCDHSLPPDELDTDDDGFALCQDDCDDEDAERTPADADGDGFSSCVGDCADDEQELTPEDFDGDGHSSCEGDCDDNDAEIGIEDLDGDGQTSCSGDCDDRQPGAHSDAAETCNGEDDDCDGPFDEGLNCGDDDDSSSLPPGHEIAYGCIVGCESAPGGSFVASWAFAALLRRRARRPV